MTPEEQLIQESKRFTENVGLPIHVGAVLYEHPRPNVHFRGRYWWICSCGKELIIPDSNDIRVLNEYKRRQCKNPTYTIELIRSELERAGKTEQLLEWIWHRHISHISGGKRYKELADILTTPLLFLQAANAYMEEK